MSGSFAELHTSIVAHSSRELNSECRGALVRTLWVLLVTADRAIADSAMAVDATAHNTSASTAPRTAILRIIPKRYRHTAPT